MSGLVGIFGGLAFAAPWALLGLIALPAVWWLLRALPPPPRRIAFPSLEILRAVEVEETTPAKPPWPLLALRLTLFTVLVLALAGPRLDPGVLPPGDRPVTIVIDDGWAAAHNWTETRQALDDVIDAAAADNRRIALVTTAPTAEGPGPVVDGGAAEARDFAENLTPHPWQPDRTAAFQRLRDAGMIEGRDIVWLSDGVDTDGAVRLGAASGANLTLWRPEAAEAPVLLRQPERDGSALTLRAEQAGADARSLTVRALDAAGAPVARAQLVFEAGDRTAEVALPAPIETLNRIARLEIAGEASAGGVVLLDSAWARRKIGIVRLSGEGGHPLLDPARYLVEALQPFSEVLSGSLDYLFEAEVDAILLPDQAGADPDVRTALRAWTEEGGLLIRFAGPRLAETPDSLTPTRLRAGGRALGGPMSWSEPLGLAPLPSSGPLAGLEPPPGVAVARQALAEPGPELAAVTWAALADGTPLVTGDALGDGLIVLVHVDAGPDWSDLPLSGFFVEMLRRLTALATNRGSAQLSEEADALSVLDGFGRTGPAGAGLDRLPRDPSGATPGPRLPPGYYGPEDAPIAFNLAPATPEVAALPALPRARAVRYGDADVTRLGPVLLLLAGLLLAAEMLATLGYSGRLPRLKSRRAAPAAIAALGAALILGIADNPADAQDAATAAALETRIAYIETGDTFQDRKSQLGIAGLGRVLFARTSVEPGPPLAINIEQDDIALLPLIYWPVTPGFPTLSEAAKAKLARYITTGGMILFDTGDADRAQTLAPIGAGTEESRALRRILADTTVPPLMPLPQDHVLTRSFYLLDQFPGRNPGGQIWVEQAGSSAYDGVTAIIIGGADWAGAWAFDESGRPVFPVSPGGDRQREIALRFGVNVVMHALTGNYKGDQVHLPAIMERIGQ